MSTALPASPPRSGILGSAVIGALAGLCVIAVVLASLVIAAVNRTPALAHETGMSVAMGINAIMVVITFGWLLALPCALLLSAPMIVGERVSPIFTKLIVWLLASLVASSPLALLVHWTDWTQRLDRPGVLHIVYAAGLIGAAAAWYWRHGKRRTPT